MGSELFFSIADRKIFDGQNVITRPRDFLQTEIPAVLLARDGDDPLETFEHVAPRLRLLRLLAFKIAPDKVLRLCDHRPLVLVLALLLFTPKLALDQKFRIISFV